MKFFVAVSTVIVVFTAALLAVGMYRIQQQKKAIKTDLGFGSVYPVNDSLRFEIKNTGATVVNTTQLRLTYSPPGTRQFRAAGCFNTNATLHPGESYTCLTEAEMPPVGKETDFVLTYAGIKSWNYRCRSRMTQFTC
ncbi:MAG: hypothetical protein ABEJ75_02260 [Candidatus Nanohaloarchaea archaeon]